MSDDRDRSRPGEAKTDTPETEIPPPKADDSGEGVDDHVVTPYPRGIGHQPTEALDPGVDDEHLSSPSQGVKPEPIPDRDPDAGS
jgi:hypothetical protein